MNIELRVIGKLKESYFKSAESEYIKRLRPYVSLEVVEHKNEASLLKAVHKDAHLVALDERGMEISSTDFASEVIAHHQMKGRGASLVFVVGGADGHGSSTRERANQLISFGRMTMGHRIVRLVMLEQIYRAFRILRGEPYHRD